ncbi:MAG: LamG domain-containing protein [Planctomycetota bacterium]
MADTVLQYSFDGTLGGDVPSGLADDTGTYTASIIAGSDADSTIKYGAANPFYNPARTSAEFYNDNWSDDAGDVLIIPDAGENDIAGLDFGPFDQFAVEAYINPASGVASTKTRRVFSKSIYCYMYLDSSQTLHAIRKWGGGDWDVKWTYLAAGEIPLDEWTHVKMTWDAHAADDKFKLYINGALADSAPGNCLPTADSSAGFAIGGYEREAGTRAQYFCGKIDEFKITDAIHDPGRYLTDPHRPVVVESDPYPTVNILLDDNATVTGQVVQIDANTFGPIDPSFTRQTILQLDPLTVTAGILAKLTPDGNTPGPGRYEYHLTRTTAGEPNYHRTMPFTVLDYSDKDRDTPSDADGMVYRDKKPWLPITVYVNSRTGSEPNTVLRDRFFDYFEDTPLCMMDYCVPRGGYDYVQAFLDRAHERSIPIMFHTPLYYFSDSEDYAIDEWFPGQDPMEVLHELISRFRDHPAVVLHYTNDERPDSMHGELRRMQTELLRHDPFHPTVVQHYGYDKIESQADTYDIYVQQRYNNNIRTFLPTVLDIQSHMIDPIPFWVNMRSNNPNIKTSSYICIAGGAKGLMFYKFATLWDDQATFDTNWALLVDMAEEIQSRQHILLQPLSPFQCLLDIDEVATRTFSGNYGTWVLIANGYWQTRTATVTVPPGTTSAKGADGTNYAVTGDQFTFSATPEDAWLIRLFNDSEQPPEPIELPGRKNPADGSPWQWTGSGTTPQAVVSYPEPNVIRVDTGASQRARWADDSDDRFGGADDGVGFTAEIRMRVTNSTSTDRGVDFELYIGDGTLPGKRYFLSVTTTALYWRGGGTVEQIATGLDNYSQMHTYRLAVRADGIAQIYRDLDLLAVRKPDFGIDPLITADGSYLQFGDGASSSETDFDVRHIAIDLHGPFDLESCIVNLNDLASLAEDWLDNDINCRANLDKTGRVDFADYSILAGDWYEQCPNGWPTQWDD